MRNYKPYKYKKRKSSINFSSKRIQRNKHPFRLLAFYVFSILFMELVFYGVIYKEFFSPSLIYKVLFSLLFALLFYFLSTLSKNPKLNFALTIFFTTVGFLLVASQYIYFKFFGTPYSIFSVQNGDQVVSFIDLIIDMVLRRSYMLIILAIPLILLCVYGYRFLDFNNNNAKHKIFNIVGAAAVYGLCLLSLSFTSKYEVSPYTLYHNINMPNYTQQEFGVLTYMRIDFQRLMFGFEDGIPDDPNVTDPMITDPNTTDPTDTDPTEYLPNILDIDFTALANGTNNKNLKAMDEYFSSIIPTMKNEYTGMFEGYNLIYLTCEGFSPWAIDKDLTPTLYKLSQESIQFKNFYNPIWGVSTSDGEYVGCTGLIPKSGVWSFYRSSENYMPFCLGNQFLGLEGYAKPYAYHNNTYTYYKRHLSHPNMGYVYKAKGNGLDVENIWPQSDLEMIEKTIDDYINEDKFHAYYMTVSGHMLYNFTGNMQSYRNRHAVSDLDMSTECKAYIACHITLDKAMEYLLNALEEAGKLDNTIIVMNADHYPYGLSKESMNEFAGHEVEETFEMYKNTCIIWKNGGLNDIVVEKPVSSLDIIPTISNLFGLKYDSRLLIGKDMLSDSEGLVIFNDRSWITDKCFYNSKTKQVTPINDAQVSDNYVAGIKKAVSNKFKYSAKILEEDYYAHVFNKK